MNTTRINLTSAGFLYAPNNIKKGTKNACSKNPTITWTANYMSTKQADFIPDKNNLTYFHPGS